MIWQTWMYFGIVLAAIAVTGFLAWQAWRQRSIAGSRYYFWLAAAICLMALGEALSMLSPTEALALFWFKMRFLPFAAIPPLWFLFVLEYSGRGSWISKRLVAGLFVIPLITQMMVWSANLQGLWVRHEVGFTRSGPFWIADITQRIPGLWFMVHTFTSFILMVAGFILLLRTAWRNARIYRLQAVFLCLSALVPVTILGITTFNLLPKWTFNPTVPSFALAILLAAAAVFRFDFLKKSPASHEMSNQLMEIHEGRSLAVFLLIFGLMAAGITASGMISYQNYQEKFRAQVEQQLLSIAGLKVKGLTEWHNERLADASLLWKSSAFAGLVQNFLESPSDTKSVASLQAWLDSLQADYQYERVFLLDRSGAERIASPATPEPVTSDLTSQEDAILKAGHVRWLDFYQDTPGGSIHLAVVVPIYAEAGQAQPLGMLVLRMDAATYLYHYLNEWPGSSPTAETLLVRQEGGDVVYLNPLRFRSDAALNLRIPLTHSNVPAVMAVKGQTGVVAGTDYRGQAVIGAIAPVPDTPWFLVARMDLAEADAPLKERLWLTILLFGSLILATGAGLAVLWRQQRLQYYRGQVQAAKAIRESETNFRALAENAGEGILIAVEGGVYVFANRAIAEISGYSVDELVHLNTQELADPDEAPKILERLQKRLAGEPIPNRYETIILNKNGQKIPIEISSNRTIWKGQPADLVFIMNISARKLAEKELQSTLEELKRSNTELEQFAYVASHDLQEPLRMVSSYVQLLERRYKGKLDQNADEFIDFAVDGAERMKHLINDLLAYSRVGRRVQAPTPTSCDEVLEQALENLQVAIRENKAIVTHDPLPEVMGDPTQLVQLFQNLIGNGIKFHGQKKPCVHISATPTLGPNISRGLETSKIWKFSVQDNGIGINPQHAERIFIIFQRLNSREKYAGTGIGLAICKKIVQHHGGRIWVESAPGQGATFFFTLPK